MCPSTKGRGQYGFRFGGKAGSEPGLIPVHASRPSGRADRTFGSPSPRPPHSLSVTPLTAQAHIWWGRATRSKTTVSVPYKQRHSPQTIRERGGQGLRRYDQNP